MVCGYNLACGQQKLYLIYILRRRVSYLQSGHYYANRRSSLRPKIVSYNPCVIQRLHEMPSQTRNPLAVTVNIWHLPREGNTRECTKSHIIFKYTLYIRDLVKAASS